MNLAEQYEDAKLQLDVSSLIDVVFLLLIYFIVTAQIVAKEGDIPFMLPADTPAEAMIDIPVEARIRINPDDSVTLEGMVYPKTDRDLKGLIERIVGLKQMADSQHSPFFVTLDPDKETVHRRIIDVMDACAAAKVKNLTFAKRDG